MKDLKYKKYDDAQIQDLMDNLRQWSLQFPNFKILDGKLLGPIAITTAFQNVAHGLGRQPSGWIVVSPNAASTIFQDQDSNNPDVKQFLRIKGSVAVSAKIWVF